MATAGESTLSVGSEEEALRYLSEALAGRFNNTHVDVHFANWPIMTIRAKGKGYDSTITPDMAEALVDLQHSMNRAYARFVHNSTNARVLTAEDAARTRPGSPSRKAAGTYQGRHPRPATARGALQRSPARRAPDV